jgi:hypothetical protein
MPASLFKKCLTANLFKKGLIENDTVGVINLGNGCDSTVVLERKKTGLLACMQLNL